MHAFGAVDEQLNLLGILPITGYFLSIFLSRSSTENYKNVKQI